ncbi:MAG: fibronectin type III domain-containing protein [Clostridium sp.]|nr:fibronectin type III domain-containing protein [Clostridium sp.]
MKKVIVKSISVFLSILMMASVFAGVDLSAYAVSSSAVPYTSVKKITSSSVQLEWYISRMDSCDYFEIAQYNYSTKKYSVIKTVKSNGKTGEKRSYTVNNLKQNTKYGFAIRSYYSIDGKKDYGAYSKRVESYTAPKETTLKSVKYSSQGKISLQWTKVSDVSGYIIQYSTSKKFSKDGSTSTVLVNSQKTTSKTISGLAQKTYYVRVCTYKKLSTKDVEGGAQYFCSDYSRIKSVSVKKGASIKTMLNSIKTTTDGRKAIKAYTNNGVDISKYDNTYDRFKAIYNWHAKHHKDNGWSCVGCNTNFNSCLYALFDGSTKEQDSFIRLAAGDVKNADGSKVIHKWPVIYLAGVPYIFDPRLQGYTGNYTGTDYFGIAKSSSKAKKMFLFDYWYSTWTGEFDSEYSNVFIHAEPKPGTTSITSIGGRPGGFKAQWEKISGAEGYQIMYSTTSDYKSNKSIYVSSSTLSKTLTGLNSNKTYYVKVRAYKTKNGKKVYGFWSATKSVKTRHKNEANGTPIKKLTANKGGFKVQWNEISNATGYEINYSTDSKFTKKNTKSVKVKGAKTTSKTISKLSKKKKYYVRIRTYRVVNGKTYYSGWTAAKSVTTKK